MRKLNKLREAAKHAEEAMTHFALSPLFFRLYKKMNPHHSSDVSLESIRMAEEALRSKSIFNLFKKMKRSI